MDTSWCPASVWDHVCLWVPTAESLTDRGLELAYGGGGGSLGETLRLSNRGIFFLLKKRLKMYKK